VFAVVLTGAPGSGKSVCLMALSDALVDDEIAHAAVDSDEAAWAYPFPDNAQRLEHVRALWESHRRAGHDVLLLAEVVESAAHLGDILATLGVADHLLVRLDAGAGTLRERIVAREPPGWSGLDYLLGYTERTLPALAALDGVHLALDSESTSPAEIAARIRSARPDRLIREPG
jgi:chloramphenicol 3-O-phosphotransferase